MNLRRLRDSVVVESPTDTGAPVNEYGDDDYSADQDWVAQGAHRCSITLRAALENEDDRETEVRTWQVLLAPSVTVTGRDRLRFSWAGVEVVARVLGEPILYRTNRGASHLDVTCQDIEG